MALGKKKIISSLTIYGLDAAAGGQLLSNSFLLKLNIKMPTNYRTRVQ